jgi:hypothetical protein
MFAAFLWLLSILPVALVILTAGVRYVRTVDQKRWDKRREGFIVTLPAGLEVDRLQAWIRHINGTYKPGLARLKGIPTYVLHITATAASTTHRIDLPHEHADALVAQLRGLMPGAIVRPDSGPEKEPWDYVLELAHSNPGRTLSVHDAELLSTGILHSFHPLYRGEAVSIQIVLSPAVPEPPPSRDGTHQSHEFGWRPMFSRLLYGSAASKDEIEDRRAKLSEPNVLAAIRIAARAETPKKAKHLTERVKSAYANPDNHATHIKERHHFMQWFPLTREILHRRFIAANAPLTFPSQFTVTELASLMGWPLGDVHAPGLPQGHSRQLPATEEVARAGVGNRTIGISNFQGQERSLAVSVKNRSRHVHVVGQTGSGKTTLLLNLIVQDIESGSGVVVIDPKSDPEGNLFSRVLNSIPKSRLDDVIVVDVNDVEYPVGFNVLQGNPSVVTSNIQSFFEHLYPEDARMVNVRKSFFHVLMTLMTTTGVPGPLTLADIEAVCTQPRRKKSSAVWSSTAYQATTGLRVSGANARTRVCLGPPNTSRPSSTVSGS